MIGERVKRYRKEAGMTLTELADKAGVAKSYLSALERNIQTNPSIQFLEKVANVLGLSIDYLLKDQVDNVSIVDEDIDKEWVNLVQEAMNSGVSKEEFRDFLEFNKWKMKQK
ncbi:helix-turn-helix domain-containing protein [Evansella cellulosilytica]|uniref:Helix-turn-helix domain protein n=1 Tax=Evansella cellulosilytica (strain ATCC 21833 / DSM 2522 / FERM P-1141 / JCM 9156 / N-4) TaxID=649639 RepID=E6TWV7_EVAC2|nr:helix-turn-helix domain-containing protein [Evansella cellulosilytica]ADU29907.1 helix-turn-helix domain protein [Evansella cellulosilytica DSM 2522]